MVKFGKMLKFLQNSFHLLTTEFLSSFEKNQEWYNSKLNLNDQNYGFFSAKNAYIDIMSQYNIFHYMIQFFLCMNSYKKYFNGVLLSDWYRFPVDFRFETSPVPDLQPHQAIYVRRDLL